MILTREMLIDAAVFRAAPGAFNNRPHYDTSPWMHPPMVTEGGVTMGSKFVEDCRRHFVDLRMQYLGR